MSIRSGHGDFKPYHDRFKHPDREARCICIGKLKSRFHFYRCEEGMRRQREDRIQDHKGKKPVEERMKFLLGPGIKIVTKWVENVGYHRPGQEWTRAEAKTYEGDYRTVQW